MKNNENIAFALYYYRNYKFWNYIECSSLKFYAGDIFALLIDKLETIHSNIHQDAPKFLQGRNRFVSKGHNSSIAASLLKVAQWQVPRIDTTS